MGEKEGEKKGEKKGHGGKEEDGPITAVLEVDMDCRCQGCDDKVKRRVKRIDGVDKVRFDIINNKLTVVGKVDPEELREKIATEMKKEVVLVSPLPKKDKKGGGGGGRGGVGEKADDKKPKQEDGPITVLQVDMHCDDCAKNVKRCVERTKGVDKDKVKVDIYNNKLTVTVVGKVDPEKLREKIETKMKKVDLVSPLPKKGGGGGDDGQMKGPITVVLNVEVYCDGCAKKVANEAVKRFDGVDKDKVKVDIKNRKLTVVGMVDPEKLRERIETKMKKKVVLVSSLPKKDKEREGGGRGGVGHKKADGKKPKQPAGGGGKPGGCSGGKNKGVREGGAPVIINIGRRAPVVINI